MIRSIITQLEIFAATGSCGGSFFGLPYWHKYLPGTCSKTSGLTLPENFSLFDALPLIMLAVVEILLRIAGMVAIAFVVYGGIQYVISEGEPDKVANAKGTIINALVGLIIATFAVAIVSFVGNRVSG